MKPITIKWLSWTAFLVKDSARKRSVFDLMSTVRLSSGRYSRLRFGRRDAPPCHVVATRHTHRHVRGRTTISTELVGSAPDMVHVLRFPTYVRSRVRRLNGDGVPYPEHGYVRNRHDASLSIAVNAATALSFRKLWHQNCELLNMLIEWRIIWTKYRRSINNIIWNAIKLNN